MMLMLGEVRKTNTGHGHIYPYHSLNHIKLNMDDKVWVTSTFWA